jgi:hypothetical protein
MLHLSMDLGPVNLAPTIVETSRPVLDVTRRTHATDVAIVYLTGHENVAELRLMLEAHPDTGFVLLTGSFPPDAAVARVVAQHGGTVLARHEPSVVIAATAVALAARRAQRTVPAS